MTVEVRRLRDDEWATLRAVRLEALRDAPYAFNSRFDDELVHDDATWRRRLGAQAWFVALDGQSVTGVASGGQLRDPDPAVRTLRSMWVAAPRRGQRVADQLVVAVASWARADGASELTLWALDASTRAHAFYRRVGFCVVPVTDDAHVAGHPAMTRYSLAL